MPSFAFLTFFCVFLAVSKNFLAQPNEAKNSSETVSNIIKIDVPKNLSLEDLETLAEFASNLQITHSKD